MNIDTERLINEVRLRPQLWNLAHNLYKDRDAKLKAWLEVCQALFPTWDDLSESIRKDIDKSVQQRWKTARDAYVRCKNTLKNTKSGSGGGKMKKYIYFDLMQFIDKHHVVDIEDSLERTETNVNTLPSRSETVEDFDYIAMSLLSTVHDSQPSVSTDTGVTSQTVTAVSTNSATSKTNRLKRNKRKTKTDDFETEMIKMFKDNAAMLQNDDMAFFCSLLPITKRFSINQKLHFRSEILKKAIEITNSCNSNDGFDRPGSSTDSYCRPGSSSLSVMSTSPRPQDAEAANVLSAEECESQGVIPDDYNI